MCILTPIRTRRSDIIAQSGRYDADVIIPGAGIAGTNAGRILQHNGLRVILLEARNRISGRIDTLYPLSGPPEEGGAEFVHGSRADVSTWRLLRRYGLHALDDSNQEYSFDDVLRDEEQSPIPHSSTILKSLRGAARARLAKTGEDESMEEFLQGLFAVSGGAEWTPQAQEMLRNLIRSEWVADTDELGLRGFLEHDFLGYGEDNFRVKEGYGELVNRMAAGLDIRLDEPVEEISQNSEAVTVRSKRLALRSRFSLVTLPLKILQNGHVRFYPQLPHWKQEAIEQLGSGDACKVILKFRERFWDQSMSVLRTSRRSQVWWDPVWGHDGKQPMLSALIGGPSSLRYQGSQEEGVRLALGDLETVFGRELGSLLEEGRVKAWSADPSTLMGYSYLPKDCPLDARSRMARPVGRVHFAGEATGPSPTVHGAIDTGAREARAILRRARLDVQRIPHRKHAGVW